MNSSNEFLRLKKKKFVLLTLLQKLLTIELLAIEEKTRMKITSRHQQANKTIPNKT